MDLDLRGDGMEHLPLRILRRGDIRAAVQHGPAPGGGKPSARCPDGSERGGSCDRRHAIHGRLKEVYRPLREKRVVRSQWENESSAGRRWMASLCSGAVCPMPVPLASAGDALRNEDETQQPGEHLYRDVCWNRSASRFFSPYPVPIRRTAFQCVGTLCRFSIQGSSGAVYGRQYQKNRGFAWIRTAEMWNGDPEDAGSDTKAALTRSRLRTTNRGTGAGMAQTN